MLNAVKIPKFSYLMSGAKGRGRFVFSMLVNRKDVLTFSLFSLLQVWKKENAACVCGQAGSY